MTLPPVTMDKKQVGAWALFDFANSVYPAVITTVVFNYYYINVVVGNEGLLGDLWWTRAVSLSALIVALSSPLLGAIADQTGLRKRFLGIYVAVCVVGVALFTTIEPGDLMYGFVLFVIANVGFEGAMVFYNAYLPDIAPPDKRGWVSGLGFGIGYLGSALGLVLAIPLRGQLDMVWLMVAAFFVLFSIPCFVLLPKDGGGRMSVAKAMGWGLTSFRSIVGEVARMKDVRRFLLAFFFYIDGVLTAIVMANSLAITTFGFTDQEAILLFLVVQFSALAGAFAFARPTDRYGPKKVLTVVLTLWTAAALSIFFIQSKQAFVVLAIFAGIGLGSAQSASRAFMSSLIPEGKEAELFGFYTLCGKSSSVMGPLIFGTVGAIWGSQRLSVMAISVLFVIGMILLQRVRDPRAEAAVVA